MAEFKFVKAISYDFNSKPLGVEQVVLENILLDTFFFFFSIKHRRSVKIANSKPFMIAKVEMYYII